VDAGYQFTYPTLKEAIKATLLAVREKTESKRNKSGN